MIKDTGERRKFETGAVRDIAEGKGRCDLLPLDVVEKIMLSPAYEGNKDLVIRDISLFIEEGDEGILARSLYMFMIARNWDFYTMLLEVSKHFEEGAKKYGEYNWQKGIPLHCYIDSGVRHYLKWCRGDNDEPHDRAFVWNILCALWTLENKPEMNDLHSILSDSNSDTK